MAMAASAARLLPCLMLGAAVLAGTHVGRASGQACSSAEKKDLCGLVVQQADDESGTTLVRSRGARGWLAWRCAAAAAPVSVPCAPGLGTPTHVDLAPWLVARAHCRC